MNFPAWRRLSAQPDNLGAGFVEFYRQFRNLRRVLIALLLEFVDAGLV